MRARWLLLTILIAFGAFAAEPDAVVTKAAEKWLVLVDTGKYGESWDQASAAFKKAVTKEQWVEAVTSVRNQVGKLEDRKLSLTQMTKDPPNAPPGEYIILQYTSNFAAKNEATETVVLSLDHDKQWRTSGYFVK